MGRGEPVSACAELLHAAAGTGSPSAGDLYRLADASLARRHHRRRPVRAARHHLDHGAQLHLRRIRQRAGDCGAVFGPQGRGARDCASRRATGRRPRPEEPANGGPGRARLYRHFLLFAVPFPVIVIAAGLTGFVAARAGSTAFQVGGDHGGGGKAETDEGLLGAELPEHARPTMARALRVSAIWLALWLIPVLVIGYTAGGDHVFTQIGLFFSKMAVVTFGGAYAVLAYMAQQAVETYSWLKPGEMLDGLGMAETTPGPLIMVVQFVGFLAAYRDPGALPPMLAGTLGGLLASWCTFVPCFLFIGLGAPFIETLRNNKPLSGALAGITAAVVGVILNLAIWFALHVWFAEVRHIQGFGFSFDAPILSTVDPWAMLLSIAAIIAIFRFKVGMIPTLAACSAAGLLLYLAGAV